MQPSPEDPLDLSDEDLPLEPFDSIDSAPDSPLLGPRRSSSFSHHQRPKWLSPRHRRTWTTCLALSSAALAALSRLRRRLPAWLSNFLDFRRGPLRPRWSFTYAFCAVGALYAVWCFVRGVPLLSSPLPPYSGPYTVGTMDLEIPLASPRKISETTFKSTGEPAFELETVLFSLYYPTDDNARSKRSGHSWLPKPISLIAKGFAKFIHMDNFIVRGVFTFALWAIGGSLQIRAKVDVPLLSSGDNESFPVIVFSHGMASSRTDYTTYLGDLSSLGYVVAAIEHRDGSSPGSLVQHLDSSIPRKEVVVFHESELESDPPMDTPKLKQEQLAFRDAEIYETIEILRRINSGEGDAVSSQTSRKEGTDLQDWTGRLDIENRLAIAGHSYGATGALQALKNASPSSPEKLSSNPATAGIALDPGKSSGPLNSDISTPLLIIHSNSWSKKHTIFYGAPHFTTVRALAADVLSRVGTAYFLTSLGTSHPSVTDAPLLEPLLLRWTTGATIDARQGVSEYVKVTDEFLRDVWEGERKDLMAEAVTHEEYGVWVSEQRKEEFPKEMKKYWEIHVSPVEAIENGVASA